MALKLGPEDRLRWALYYLLLEANEMRGDPATGKNVVRALIPEKRHPFGLQIPEAQALSDHQLVWFVGHPGHTDESVASMARLIGWNIAHAAISSGPVQYLRIILAECDSEDASKHDVYFEIGQPGDVFLCGGCTDCSGAGSTGKDTLESIFELLAELYGVAIERVSIPFVKARRVRSAIRGSLAAWSR